MGRRERTQSRAMERGQVGVDGAAVEEKQDAAEVELGKAREQYLRGKSFLGRELLTWLLWRSESSAPLLRVEGSPLKVVFAGRLSLKAIAGEVVELAARGASAPYSVLVRSALERGMLVHSARLVLEHGEAVFEATLDAEYLDVKSAKLPDLAAGEPDDRVRERLLLAERLSRLVGALTEEFLKVRASRRWSREEVPRLRAWMRGEAPGESKARRRG